MDYHSLAELAHSMGYTEFTQLQQDAFHNPQILDPNRNILVIGPTSSGKTLIPMLMYYQRVREANLDHKERPKMLFIVPYRALASQKCAEIVAPFQKVYGEGRTLWTVQSTGEYRYADGIIQRAEMNVAVVISEKAFLFSCENHAFLSQFDEVVFDEIGLLADEGRGAKLDFLLAWCHMLQRDNGHPRMTLLATPYYDWSAYIEKFDLTLVRSNVRPVLLERPVFVIGKQEKKVAYPAGREENAPLPEVLHICREGKKETTRCDAVMSQGEEEFRCSTDMPCRSNSAIPCVRIGRACTFPIVKLRPGMPYKSYVIARLCRWHLKYNRQVLIFWNNREEVRQLALCLYDLLRDSLPDAPSLEECKKQVLDGCSEQIKSYDGASSQSTKMTEDELYGVLEDNHYRALCSGIGFHSSAVPNELRCYIEEQFLERGKLKIVCSTETLAYGVNSAVDVVIIADMTKMKGQVQCVLSANEYQNYVGRAGRLRPGKSLEDIVGWIHPIINGHSPDDKQFEPDEGMYAHWMKIRNPMISEMMYSRIFDADNQFLPFMLLCLLPDKSDVAVGKEKLLEWLEQLPRIPGQQIMLDPALDFLQQENLVKTSRTMRRLSTQNTSPRYYVTERGQQIRGYTPSIDDYKCVLKALTNSLKTNPWEIPVFQEAVFIYDLLDAPCLKNDVFSLDLDRLTAKQNKQEQSGEKEQGTDTMSREKMEQLLDSLPIHAVLQPLLKRVDLNQVSVRKKCLLTAAILCWADSMNPHKLYSTFAITYPLIQSLTHQMSFLMDVAGRITDVVPRTAGELITEYSQRQKEVSDAIRMLSRSIYFGIQRQLYEKMLAFFLEAPSVESKRIYENLLNPQPSMARQLRRLTEYHRLLSGPSSNEWALVQKRLSARKEIKKLSPLWAQFIQSVKEE